MAKVIIEFDTIEKSLAVKVGDKVMSNLNGIYFYQSYDRKGEYSLELSTMSKSEDDDILEITRICASENIVVKNEDEKEKTIAKLSQLLFKK